MPTVNNSSGRSPIVVNSPTFPQSKTLFRKSNILHIRTNEGEFEVSNPEVLTCLHIRHMPDGDWRIKTPGSGWTGEDVKWPVEWPYGVELNWRIAISTARDTKYTSCTEEYAKSNPGFHSYAIARLLPKEEKKDDIQPKRWEESTSIPSESDYKEEFKPAQPTPNFPKGGTTFTESAYKEEYHSFSSLKAHDAQAIKGTGTFFRHRRFESPEPQERDTTLLKLLALKRFTEDRIKNLIYFDEDKQAWAEDQKSAPSESQEEHAKRFAEWLRKNNWSAIPKSEQHWFNILSGEKLRTTNDLYSDFTRNP